MWSRAGLALAIFALGIVAGVAASVVISGVRGGDDEGPDPSAVEVACGADTEPLDIAADDAVVELVRELADRYAEEVVTQGRTCVDISVRAVSSAAVAGRLANGWKETTHGPRPEVWIPQSAVWLELLRTELEDPSILAEEPTVLARSPTVMAMPQPMAEAIGWPDEQVSWQRLAELASRPNGWARVDRPEWGRFRLWSTDPRYTTNGLQTLLALDDARPAPDEEDEVDTLLRLFRVQRLLTAIDPSSEEQLARYAAGDAEVPAVSAFPLEERQVWEFNRDRGGGAAASDQPGAGSSPVADGPPPLAAVHPTGDDRVAMESDYPYVVLAAPWVSQEVLQYADEFGDFLLGDIAQARFADAGFRGPDNTPGDALTASGLALPVSAEVPAEPSTGALPDIAALQELRASWVNVPRLSTTLFVVDVSGSMVETVPGTDLTRLEATIEAARRTLDIIPPGGDVGLWEFSTDLQGGRNDGDYRQLVTIGPLDETIYGQARRNRLVEALDELQPANDTALNDTVLAAYRAMDAQYEAGDSHTIILLTDGRNDDEDSLSHEQLLDRLVREREVNRPIRVVSIAYGEQPDIDKLAEISEVVGGEVLASPELDNLDELFIEALSGPGLDRT